MSAADNSNEPWASHEPRPGSALGNMDSELASIVSSLSALSNVSAQQPHGQIGSFRRTSFHSNNGSDIDSEVLFQSQASPVIKRTTLSVGGVSLGTPSGANNRLNMLGNYSASIAGGVLQHQQQQQGGFFERFGRSLAEGTREVEMNLGASSGRGSRRESFSAMESLSRVASNSTYQGAEERRPSISSDALDSVSESLNMQGDNSGNQRNASSLWPKQWSIGNVPVFRPQGTTDASYPAPDMYNNPYGFSYNGFQQFGGPMMPPMVPPTPTSPAAANVANNSGSGASELGRFDQSDEKNNAENGPQQMPPFMFPPNPYVYFPPGTNAPQPPQMGSMLQAPTNVKDSSKTSHPSKPHGNPYLYNSRNNRQSTPGTTIPQFTPSTQQRVQSPSPSNGSRGKNKNNIPRSPLLEEFRSNSSNKSYKLSDIYGSALEFCKDQHGSRFIQQELAKASDAEKEVIFNEIRDEAISLSDDVFGNYVIQKFFEHGLKIQKDVLFKQFTGKMEQLSLQMYACRVIQRALECIEDSQKIALVRELSNCVLLMIKDQNGNHVIQKAIECIPIDELPFILASLHGQIYHLSTHSYGCRVVQRLLEYGSVKDQDQILDELDQFIPYLIQNQYGNYVIQHILQHGQANIALHIGKTKQEIVDTVAKNVVEYSKHKFASNVVEKTILYGSEEQKRQFMDKVLPKNPEHAAHLEDTAPLILMMRDQYANYVVQKLVGVAEGSDKKLIVIAIRAYLDKLNKINALGNRHLASVEKLAAIVEKVEI
ncbi:LAFE_0A06502g1_1 [Lachancea fermentati]|uniref:Pumilio homology domain family member 3 n=1 Tax=Lachancea fermentati TaxID=4955 RepID=A0A1G4M7B3_LACFM|nr:LAFE_0A06502g1_1 [Lachancea fermentati]